MVNKLWRFYKVTGYPHTRAHQQLYLSDTTEFKVSHYMLDLCRVSSLRATLLCSLICIPKCHLVFPSYCCPQEEVLRQTTWVGEQVIARLSLRCLMLATVLHNWLALMVFSKTRGCEETKVGETKLSKVLTDLSAASRVSISISISCQIENTFALMTRLVTVQTLE